MSELVAKISAAIIAATVTVLIHIQVMKHVGLKPFPPPAGWKHLYYRFMEFERCDFIR